MWSGSPAKRGSLDNYHHGISQPCSISCYFWATPFEVFSLFYLPLTKHCGATGTGEAAEQLNCRPFKRCWLVSVADYTASLVSWFTLVPIERMDDFSFCFFLFFSSLLSLLRTSRLPPVLLSPCLCCRRAPRCVGEILDYSNHGNQCLLFNVEFPE